MSRTAITPRERRSARRPTKARGLLADHSGFTLPEMTIVIVIMGIVLAISSASWFGAVESRRVDSATNQLVSDLRLAHSKATNRVAEHYIAYVPDSTVRCSDPVAPPVYADYCLVRSNGAGGYDEYKPRDLPDDTEISGSSLTDDTVSGFGVLLGVTPKTLKFKPDGSAEAMGGLIPGETTPTITVTIDEQSNPNHVIEVNAATSRTKVG